MARTITIDRIGIKQFGCIRDMELKLSPLHAVIGPNDSGKSTVLRAVRTGMQLLTGNFSGGFPEHKIGANCYPFHPGIHEKAELKLTFDNGFIYSGKISGNDHLIESVSNGNDPDEEFTRQIWDAPTNKMNLFIKDLNRWAKNDLLRFGLPETFNARRTHGKLSFIYTEEYDDKIREAEKFYNSQPSLTELTPRMVRLDPDSLRLPGGLIPSSQPIEIDEKGTGLATIYDSLMNKNVDFFIAIREQVKKLFPTVSTIGLKNVNVSNDKIISKILELELKNGQRISAQFMSEGMLYYLAFAALKYLEPASILLVEEPENGLHPSRIKEIMTILREISETTQILIATHSPLVINELKDDEVSVVWREDDGGTKAMPIAETAHFAERSKVYALGELWLSYANGIDEKPLREGDAQ